MKYICLLIMVFLFGCWQPDKKPEAKNNQAICLKNNLLTADSNKIKTALLEKEDSIWQAKLIDTAMAYAISHQAHTGYKKIISSNDTLHYAKLNFGHLFAKKQKHLIIKTESSWNISMRIFLLQNKKFKELTQTVIWDLNYVADTIRDVNGDGFKDFILTTYSTAGCCARNRDEVRLYTPINGKFSEAYVFMNPTYFPKQKTIRGVNYGHPGEVPLYKYKWNGLDIDTIEYIYPADTLKKKFYRVTHYGDGNNPKKRLIISTVPKEYRRIVGYDWFINY